MLNFSAGSTAAAALLHGGHRTIARPAPHRAHPAWLFPAGRARALGLVHRLRPRSARDGMARHRRRCALQRTRPARAVVEFINALGLRDAILVGGSMGAAIALHRFHRTCRQPAQGDRLQSLRLAERAGTRQLVRPTDRNGYPAARLRADLRPAGEPPHPQGRAGRRRRRPRHAAEGLFRRAAPPGAPRSSYAFRMRVKTSH